MRTHSNRKARPNRPANSIMEPLEPRQLMSASLAAATWTIRGDQNHKNLNDTISLTYNAKKHALQLTENGKIVATRPTQFLRTVVIDAGKGTNTISVDLSGTNIHAFVQSTAGKNTLHAMTRKNIVTKGKFAAITYGPQTTLKTNITKSTSTNSNSSTGSTPTNPLTTPITNPATPTPDAALFQTLIDQAVARWQNQLGHPYAYPVYTVQPFSGTVLYATNTGSTSATTFSTTNTQVQGVDETDPVQTDGNYIYSIINGSLTIVDVRNPATASIISTTELPADAIGLYLVDGHLVVLSQAWTNSQTPGIGAPKTTISILDVSAPTHPATLKTTTVTGSPVTTRVIGDQLYLVLQNNVALPAPQLVASTDGSGTSRYQTETEYRAWLGSLINDFMPSYSVTAGDGSTLSSGYFVSQIANLQATADISTVTTVMDIDAGPLLQGPVSQATISGSPSRVYVSAQNLYICTQQYVPHATQTPVGSVTSDIWTLPFFYTPSSQTQIAKFGISPGNVTLNAVSVPLDGSVNNSYDIDEYNGQLRVVTENYDNTGSTHTLYVLSDNSAGQLTITGSIANLGNGEQLRSVLFLQDRAFVVTFRTVDPLFAIDLSDPANPKQTGELVMPGFSSYLFPVDRNHLIGVGQGDDGNNNFHNVQISLYDVSDLANPRLIDQRFYKTDNGSGSVASQAQYDPHAFSYFPDQGIVAIPIDNYNYSSVGSNQNTLELLKVDTSANTPGFTDVGQVSATANITRSLRIGDNLYTISTNSIKIVQLDNPTNVIAEVALPGTPNFGYFPITGPIIMAPGTFSIGMGD